MRILFIHQNFPGQFKFLAPALVELGHEVLATTAGETAETKVENGIKIISYPVDRSTSPTIHPWLSDMETKMIRADGCMRACDRLKQEGFVPDLIVAHHGWGESLLVKEVWPSVKLALYCEFFYATSDLDADFDPEFSKLDLSGRCRLRMKNINNILHMDIADAAISPTKWQADTFPLQFRKKIKVVHDGIDTQNLVPSNMSILKLSPHKGLNLELTRKDEVLTFVNRNLEPYRGYHKFMRALPKILKARPKLRVLIIGGNGASYGAEPDPIKYNDKTWRDIFAEEVRPQIPTEDWERIHFLGNVSYNVFIEVLRISSVHVYLTYPFVLSWSLLEAMSLGCSIVASKTGPVVEFIEHEKSGVLVDFFDHDGLANEVLNLLGNDKKREKLGERARAFVQKKVDLRSVCLPAQLNWIESLL